MFSLIGDLELTFVEDELGRIIDKETGSRWDYFGLCVEGENKGQRLEAYFFAIKEWYAWYTYHPDTEVYHLN